MLLTLPGNQPIQLPGLPAGVSRTIQNLGAVTIYYGDANVGPSSNAGAIGPGKTATLTGNYFLLASGKTSVIDDEPSERGDEPWEGQIPPGVESSSVGNSNRTRVFYGVGYGVKANGRTVTDATITNGQANVGSVQAAFNTLPTPSSPTGDLGKLAVFVNAGAGNTHLYSTIQSVANGVATLSNNAGATVAAGGEFFYASDDTLAAQACLNDAAAVIGTAEFPDGDMGLSATLTTGPGAITVRGQGIKDLFQGTGVNLNFPTVVPYLEGTVFVMCKPALDILQGSPDDGVAQAFHRFGLRFAGRYINTGNGLSSAPPNNAHMGDINGIIEDVHVFGHDGNHYGFLLQSQMLNRYTGLRAYGGGGMRLLMASGLTGGNYSVEDYYTCTYIGGTAHGLFLDGVGNFQYCLFKRAQTWVFAPTSQPAGTVAPTNAQFCLQTTNPANHLAMGFELVDFETNVASKVVFPFGFKCFHTNDPSAAIDATNNVTNNPGNGVGFQNVRGGGIMSVHTFILAPLAAASVSTTLSIASGALATSITVTSATGFAAGQGIQIDTGTAMEFAIIKSVVGNVLNLIAPGGYGLLSAHALNATVAAGAAVVVAQTANTNTWDGARWGMLGAPIGNPVTTQVLNFVMTSDWWGRLDWANASREGSQYSTMVG